MQDIVVIQSLQERGFDFRNVTEALRYEAPEHLPRILDKPPKRISLRKAKDIPVYGCKQEFIMAYNDLLREVNSDVFSLDFKGNLKYCDKEVFVALQTLITQSLCKTKERAEACFDLFRIISTAPFDTLTLERIYTTLSSYTTTNYYAGQLLEALHVCLFNTDSVILHSTKFTLFILVKEKLEYFPNTFSNKTFLKLHSSNLAPISLQFIN